MTPARQPQDPADVLFICSLEDLNCLHDYIMAAMAGEDLSELPRLWNQQIGVIRSRPHTSPPAPKQGKSKLCFGTITLVAEECRKCNEIESCEQKQSIIDYQKREIAQEAAKAAREKVLDVFAEVEYLHNVDEITYPDLYNEFIQRYKSLRGAQREQGGVSE